MGELPEIHTVGWAGLAGLAGLSLFLVLLFVLSLARSLAHWLTGPLTHWARMRGKKERSGRGLGGGARMRVDGGWLGQAGSCCCCIQFTEGLLFM